MSCNILHNKRWSTILSAHFRVKKSCNAGTSANFQAFSKTAHPLRYQTPLVRIFWPIGVCHNLSNFWQEITISLFRICSCCVKITDCFQLSAGSLIYTAPYFTNLSILDRLTAVTLINSLLEYDLDQETYLRYDSITAQQLFSSVSPALYRSSSCQAFFCNLTPYTIIQGIKLKHDP